jgi:hypothetical protein
MFNDNVQKNMYVYCVYPVILKDPKQLPHCLKIAEISVVFAAKQARKAHQKLASLHVSKACANKLYIFRQYTDIVYLSFNGSIYADNLH